jgi:mannosyltransferase
VSATGFLRRREIAWLAAITATAALLRFVRLDASGFWFDEAVTSELLKLPLGSMISHLPNTELTPPLYYLLAWPWTRVFGAGESGLRSLSALCGVAVVPVAYAIVGEIASRRAALVTAAVVAFNPLLIWYSQEARPYALLVLLCALSLMFALRRRIAWWAVVSALALLTHYFAAFLFVPEALWLLHVDRRRLAVLVAGGLVACVGLALTPLAVHEAHRVGSGYISSLPLPRRLERVFEDFVTGFVVNFHTATTRVLAWAGAAVALAGAAVALLFTDARERRAAVLLGGIGLSAVAMPLALSIGGLDYLNTRNMLPAAVPLVAVPAIGYASARLGPAVSACGTAALCALGLTNLVVVARDPALQRSNWRGAARGLGQARGPRVVAVPPVDGTVTLGHYLPGARPLPPGGALVEEVGAATLVNPHAAPYSKGLSAPLPKHVGRFALVGVRKTRSYIVARYRSPTPVRVTSTEARRIARPVFGAPAFILQVPGAASVSPFDARY